MKIYVASSWRNPIQPEVVKTLREKKHQVYDFKNPESHFNWRETASEHELNDANAFTAMLTRSKLCSEAFMSDMNALDQADVVILVLPCGRSAHLELGYAVGQQKPTLVLLDNPISEPELMYLMNTRLCTSIEEVADALSFLTKYRPGQGPWWKTSVPVYHML